MYNCFISSVEFYGSQFVTAYGDRALATILILWLTITLSIWLRRHSYNRKKDYSREAIVGGTQYTLLAMFVVVILFLVWVFFRMPLVCT